MNTIFLNNPSFNLKLTRGYFTDASQRGNLNFGLWILTVCFVAYTNKEDIKEFMRDLLMILIASPDNIWKLHLIFLCIMVVLLFLLTFGLYLYEGSERLFYLSGNYDRRFYTKLEVFTPASQEWTNMLSFAYRFKLITTTFIFIYMLSTLINPFIIPFVLGDSAILMNIIFLMQTPGATVQMCWLLLGFLPDQKGLSFILSVLLKEHWFIFVNNLKPILQIGDYLKSLGESLILGGQYRIILCLYHLINIIPNFSLLVNALLDFYFSFNPSLGSRLLSSNDLKTNTNVSYTFNKLPLDSRGHRLLGGRVTYLYPFNTLQSLVTKAASLGIRLSMNHMQVRSISGSSVPSLLDSLEPKNQMAASQEEFFEWLAGFTDAEGTFYVGISSNKKVSLRYRIGLHIDDRPVLEYIVGRLGFGKIYSYKNSVELVIYKREDLKKVIEIFSKYPLQSTKWLNFRDFSRCFELLSDKVGDSLEIKHQIINIKNNMNNLCTNYELPATKTIHITKYWFLGFIEGEGSFTVTKGNKYQLFFSLNQAGSNLPLMIEIQNFLENLSGTNGLYSGAFKVTTLKTLESNHNTAYRIKISNTSYFRDAFIPLLLSLQWVSKKRLDFYDWVFIFLLRENGHHYLENGQTLIELFLSQMNNNRLSTQTIQNINAKGILSLDRTQLVEKSKKLINGPSNYEINNGIKFVVSENKPIIPVHRSKVGVEVIDSERGNIIQTFESYHECASFFGVTHPAVTYRIKNKNTFKAPQFDNKTVYLKRI
uniref:LAGLIDADG endonuclease n=1 Tax=Juglanconis oblonga TaxID=1940568 RepID=A0A291LIN8_9PEZI|nr:LAGLIDADG endonuclease [Juglanconis oblonga]